LPSHRRCLTAKRWHSARTHSAITPSATPARRRFRAAVLRRCERASQVLLPLRRRSPGLRGNPARAVRPRE
jgi:hypothetical protein